MPKDDLDTSNPSRLAQALSIHPEQTDGLSDDDKEALRLVWKTELDELAKGIIEAKEDRVRDQIGQYLRDKKKALMDKIRSSKGGGE